MSELKQSIIAPEPKQPVMAEPQVPEPADSIFKAIVMIVDGRVKGNGAIFLCKPPPPGTGLIVLFAGRQKHREYEVGLLSNYMTHDTDLYLQFKGGRGSIENTTRLVFNSPVDIVAFFQHLRPLQEEAKKIQRQKDALQEEAKHSQRDKDSLQEEAEDSQGQKDTPRVSAAQPASSATSGATDVDDTPTQPTASAKLEDSPRAPALSSQHAPQELVDIQDAEESKHTASDASEHLMPGRPRNKEQLQASLREFYLAHTSEAAKLFLNFLSNYQGEDTLAIIKDTVADLIVAENKGNDDLWAALAASNGKHPRHGVEGSR